eukprot:s2320_g15.t1
MSFEVAAKALHGCRGKGEMSPEYQPQLAVKHRSSSADKKQGSEDCLLMIVLCIMAHSSQLIIDSILPVRNEGVALGYAQTISDMSAHASKAALRDRPDTFVRSS